MDNASNPAEEVAPTDDKATGAGVAPETETDEGQVSAEDEADAGTSDGEDDGEGEPEQVEEIELNFGGDKLRVPKGAIPDEVAAKIGEFSKNMESGYTKKFQAVADQAKSIEAREKAVAKLEGLHGDTLQNYARGLQVRSEIEQLSQVDVNALWQSNPDQARRVSDALAAKRSEFQAIVNQVAQKEHELSSAQQAELARRADEGRSKVERHVAGFTEKVPDVVDYVVKNYGGDPKHLSENWHLSPVEAVWAYKAMMWDRSQAQAKKPPAKPTVAAPVAPMRTPGTAQNRPSGPSDKDDIESWMRKRQAKAG